MESQRVIVSGAFDDLRFRDFRFLDEAARLGELTVALWSDGAITSRTGKPPKFPLAERQYLIESLRPVTRVQPVDSVDDPDAAPVAADRWVVREHESTAARRDWCARSNVSLHVITDAQLDRLPEPPPACPFDPPTRSKKVVVTGCFDWFHSGHVRFFEEVSGLGDLYAVVGHDANIRLLKGEGHPLFPAEQRRYIAGLIRFTTLALISTGDGWMDAEPEFAKIRPHIYAVNEDGDRPEKRAFCQQHGIEYVVLKRLPKQGLPRRQSTALRGF
jgi:cytidyltransferase-like protein